MSRLPAALILGAVLASATGAQDLTKKVTYAAPAAPVKSLLRDLSAVTGVPMDAYPTTASEVVLVKVKDVTVDELMTRIATAIDGEWEKVGQGYRLGRSAATLQRELNTERAKRVAYLKKAIASQAPEGTGQFDAAAAQKLATEMAAQVDREMDGQQMRDSKLWMNRAKLQARTPAGILMTRVMSTLDLAAVADLPDETRWVFSTSPTRMQRPLPAAALQAVDQYVRDQALWSAAVRHLPFKPREGMEEDNGAPPGFWGYEKVKGTPAQALIILYRMPRNPAVSCELLVVDNGGKIIARNGASLTLSPESGFAVERRAASKEAGPKVELSSITKRIFDRFVNQGRGYGDPTREEAPLPADLRERMTHPETYEPLSTFASDFLMSYAAYKSANVVACMPDSLQVMMLLSAQNEAPGLLAVKSLAETYGDVQFDESPGWVVAHPGSPAEARAARMDRQQLGQFVRGLAASPPPGLDALADLAQHFGNPAYSEMVIMNLLLLSSDAFNFWDMPNWDLLRFYGTLGPAQRRDLRQGAKIRLAQLSTGQRAALNKIVFFSQTSLTFGLNGPVPEAGDTIPTASTTTGEQGELGDLRTEPTEALPNGLPPDGILTFNVDQVTIAAPVTKVPWMSRGMPPEEIGSLLVMKERPETAAELGVVPDLSKFRLGIRETLTVQVQFTPDLSYADSITSSTLSETATPYAQLPKAFLAAVEKAMKEYREALKEQGTGTATPPVQGGTPPPALR